MQLLPGLQLSQITNNTMHVAVILTHSYNYNTVSLNQQQ